MEQESDYEYSTLHQRFHYGIYISNVQITSHIDALLQNQIYMHVLLLETFDEVD